MLLLTVFWCILSCTKSLSQSVNIDMYGKGSWFGHCYHSYFARILKWKCMESFVQVCWGCCCFTRNLCDTSEATTFKTAAKKARKWYCFRISWLKGDTYNKWVVPDISISELQHRFADKNLEHMKSVGACSPDSPHFLEPKILLSLAEPYGLDTNLLSIECILARSTLNAKDLDSISEVLQAIFSLK